MPRVSGAAVSQRRNSKLLGPCAFAFEAIPSLMSLAKALRAARKEAWTSGEKP